MFVVERVRDIRIAPPDDPSHLLSTTSVIQSIEYTPNRVSHTKFEPPSVAAGLVTGGLLR